MVVSAFTWAQRAQTAARSVHLLFGQSLIGLPGTWLGAPAVPRLRGLHAGREWHYWWQAHYLDCLVDAASRAMGSGGGDADGRIGPDDGGPADPLLLAFRLLRTIRLRNWGRLTNSFYDDMAWLALAAKRLDAVAAERAARGSFGAQPPNQQRGRLPRMRPVRLATRTLHRQLERAWSSELGGGIYWSRARDYKNTPANGPAALYFARAGDPTRAAGILDWLELQLFDPELGLFLDGVHPTPEGPVLERPLYTYNQGPVLGALLELGGAQNLARAADLVAAIHRHLTVQRGQAHPLLLHEGGDGGLFTGILARYLALAARDPALPAPTRALATRLVLDTADALWDGRCPAPPRLHPRGSGTTTRTSTGTASGTGASVGVGTGETGTRLGTGASVGAGVGAGVDSQLVVFPAAHSPGPTEAPGPTDAPGPTEATAAAVAPTAAANVVELSSQLQAWMTFEAAALLTSGSPHTAL